MNFRKRGAALPQFQMTAMMDIVFLLLCFFVTSSVFSQWEYEVNLTLPSAKSGQSLTRLPGEIILNVAKDGKVSVNQRVFYGEDLDKMLKQMAEFLPGQPVIIRADTDASYGTFMKVVDACRMVGISNLSLATAEAPAPTKVDEAPTLAPPPEL